jgi:hypothetical protein
MNNKTKTALRFGVSALIVLLAAGCTMNGGEVSDKDRNKIMTCKDTRDGETFSFNTNTITNIRRGIGAPHTFDVVTTDGKSMSLSTDMEAWLKCKKSS